MTCRSDTRKLRPYQAECIASIPESGAYMIQMATGLGKTFTFSQIPRRGRVLLLSHRQELVTQPVKYYDCSVGIECGRYHSDGEEVVSASVQSMVKRLDRFDPDDFDMIITDEAHHAAASTYQKIYGYFCPRLHLGFTATPVRGDCLDLSKTFESIIFEYPIMDGIKNGYLCPVECRAVSVGVSLKGVRKRMGDFAEGDLEKIMNQEATNDAIAQIYKEMAKGPTLIFAVSVAHAEAIAELIPGAVAVTGKTKDRARILEDFVEGRVKVLVSVMVLTEGTDLPNIETIINARPTCSQSLYIQMVGRGLRLSPETGKTKLNLIDITDSHALGLCSPATLIGLNVDLLPAEKRGAIDGDLEGLEDRALEASECPESWVMNERHVNLFAKQHKVVTHGIRFIEKPDGSLHVYLPDKVHYEIAPVDASGKVMGKSLQYIIDDLYRHLQSHHADERVLWDTAAGKSWSEYQATDKQKNIIHSRFPNFDITYLTRGEASAILARILN